MIVGGGYYLFIYLEYITGVKPFVAYPALLTYKIQLRLTSWPFIWACSVALHFYVHYVFSWNRLHLVNPSLSFGPKDLDLFLLESFPCAQIWGLLEHPVLLLCGICQFVT